MIIDNKLNIKSYCQGCPDFTAHELNTFDNCNQCINTIITCANTKRCERIAKRISAEKDHEIYRLNLEMADLKFRMNCEELFRKFINNEK